MEKFSGPKWVANQKLWDKAEKSVKKRWNKYKEPYKVVADVYFKMGGKKKTKKSALNRAIDLFVKFASRKEVLDEIEHTWYNLGVITQAPFMRESGKDQWKGDIDDHYSLEAKDKDSKNPSSKTLFTLKYDNNIVEESPTMKEIVQAYKENKKPLSIPEPLVTETDGKGLRKVLTQLNDYVFSLWNLDIHGGSSNFHGYSFKRLDGKEVTFTTDQHDRIYCFFSFECALAKIICEQYEKEFGEALERYALLQQHVFNKPYFADSFAADPNVRARTKTICSKLGYDPNDPQKCDIDARKEALKFLAVALSAQP